ncbi:MAG: hypothetical protein Q8930_12205 [Bacillota bacterium]|nr:hypothetical protein [Bacillota bacterium]
MKKTISLFLFVFVCILCAPLTARAENISVPPSNAYEAQIKERVSIINEKVKSNRKIQAEINKKSKRAADLYLTAFGRCAAPNQADIKKAEMMEAQLGKIAEQVILVDKMVTDKIHMAAMHAQHGHPDMALSSYDAAISLIDKLTDVFKRQNDYLQNYIDFLSSLRHK